MLIRMGAGLKMKSGRLTDEKVGIVTEMISQREILLKTGEEEYRWILISEILDIRLSN